MSYFLENEEVNEAVEEVKAQDGIASIEPLLDNRIVRAIREMGFEKLSPIQEMCIRDRSLKRSSCTSAVTASQNFSTSAPLPASCASKSLISA